MRQYNPREVEKKWQKRWEEQGLHRALEQSAKPKLYVLDMFPYPSGDGLHVGHVEGYTATDIYSRYQRMKGYNVLHPMGWDAFGLPAENYAIKTGIHPTETTQKAMDTFRRQITELGLSYDWSREIGTHTPEYYKWTQWFFLLLYKNGLAYKAKANVNWCPSCKTVLANEQVVNGTCERCHNQVVQKELEQWFFKITDFAEALISDLDEVDWPESTVRNQRNWIGKSEGALLEFPVADSEHSISVFTTRPDTLFGATYMVLAPDHELVEKLQGSFENKGEVEAYVAKTREKTELERTAEEKEKTGVELKGVKAVNPANREEIPIYIADYVLSHYGTGAIMAVPAHDERDFAFAKKFNLPIRPVVIPAGFSGELQEAFVEPGTMVNSGKFDGMASQEAKEGITEEVGGEKKTTYKLRDWLISRQRYWGAPIPIVYDPEGSPHPIPEEHLPWLLPTDVEFRPTGTSPLAESKEFLERTEKLFGKGWRPEADTMDTFVCSSWYYFRFADPRNEEAFASKERLNQWLPVDVYVGGAEHTVLHLMYARFFTKVLQKFGYVEFSEPFLKLRHPGTILGPDGYRMSKSRGNVVNPDSAVQQYGADTIRMYEMFMGPLADPKPWNTQNIVGVRRFLEKVWRLQEKAGTTDESRECKQVLHQTIKKVGEDIETLDLNTAISQLMIAANAMEKEEAVSTESFQTLLLLLAPFAPHLAEELWDGEGSIHEQEWPSYDPELVRATRVRLVLQVNGKVRDALEVEAGIPEEKAKELALQSERVRKWLEGEEPKKVIVVPDKLVNVVV